ncbi:MAG: transposase [Planctomyces sp.]
MKSPWSVSQVTLDLQQQQQVDVFVEHPSGTKFCCPECSEALPCHDHTSERQWRHLDSCQFKTLLYARIPRVNCPQHGVKQVQVRWAAKGSRFTILFERFAIQLLLATQTVTGAMSILRTKWDQTWSIVERAVARGKERKESRAVPRLGIDEKAYLKGQSCITLLCDPGMSAAYVKAAKHVIPLAENRIVHDRFHVMQMATKAVDKVRRGKHRQLMTDVDDSLSKTKYVWLTSFEILTEKQQTHIRCGIRSATPDRKGLGVQGNAPRSVGPENRRGGDHFLQQLVPGSDSHKTRANEGRGKFHHERLRIVVSNCAHKTTNAVAEGMNSKIMSIKRRAGGFRNRENFKTAIFFNCGGLSLDPQ